MGIADDMSARMIYPNGEEKRNRIMAFIVSFKERHDGLSPSMREIMDGCGMFSTSHVDYYLQQLEEMDLIKRSGRRGIQVIGGVWLKPEEPEVILQGKGTVVVPENIIPKWKEKHDWRNVDF